MKNRTGFVSNSSSSSFIIYKPLLTTKQINKIKKWFEDNRENIFDDSGTYLDESGNYISVNCNSKSDEFSKMLLDMKIKKEDIYYSYS